MSDTLKQIFAKMNFFELVEDNEQIIYCYEVKDDGNYLIASNELGNTPKEGEIIIIACYSPQDTFLWKMELNNIQNLLTFYQEHEKEDFIKALQEKYS